MSAPLLVPGSTRLRWRQSDVEVWLAALPTRAVAKPQPRRYKDKARALTGDAAIWEKHKGLWGWLSAGRGAYSEAR